MISFISWVLAGLVLVVLITLITDLFLLRRFKVLIDSAYKRGIVDGYYKLLRNQGRSHESALDKIKHDFLGESNGEK